MVKIVILAAAAAAFSSTVSAACSTIHVRKDWRNLTETERQRYIDAQQTLWKQDIDDKGLSRYERDYVAFHRQYTPEAHLVPTFLPWHRRFLRDYEQALREIDPEINLPYWNWADDYYGGDGDPNNDHCVSDGRFANWTLNLGGDLTDPSIDKKHCLRRFWAQGISSPGANNPVVHPTPALLSGLREFALNNSDYAGFRYWLDGDHGTIHLGVGGFSTFANGDMAPVECSPNDPMFWLHHTMVDRVWWLFQQVSPQSQMAYGGKPDSWSSLPRNDSIWQNGGQLTDLMPPWNAPVSETMITEGDEYCYTYE